jgi:hypothetical protein
MQARASYQRTRINSWLNSCDPRRDCLSCNRHEAIRHEDYRSRIPSAILALFWWRIVGGWPAFNDLCVRHSHRGCPILAFLQGWAVMMRVLSDFAVGGDSNPLGGRNSRRVAQTLNCRSYRNYGCPVLRVRCEEPALSRRRGGCRTAKSESFWLDGLKRAVRTYPIGSIVPALAQNAKTGHRSFRTGKKKGHDRAGHPPARAFPPLRFADE